MSLQSTTKTRLTVAPGVACYRSADMTQRRAESFARCLRANKSFADATIHPAPFSTERYFVAYLPSATKRQEDIFCRYQQEQIDRAIAEMDGYEYATVPTAQHLTDVTTLPDHKGKRDTYRVDRSAHTCTCPHYIYRLRAVGAVCKHLVACEITQPPVPVFVAAVRHAMSERTRKTAEQDFC